MNDAVTTYGSSIRLDSVLAGISGGAVLYTRITSKRIEREVPADGTFLDVSGARLHYLDRGAGPPIMRERP